MKLFQFTEATSKWKQIKLRKQPINFKSNDKGFSFKYRTAEGDFQIVLTPQECDNWLGEFTIAAKQVEG